MNTILLSKIEKDHLQEVPEFNVGDTVKVHLKIVEGEKHRIQLFTGIVLAMKGSGTRKTFVVRKISNGVGVERILPLHSPNIAKIEIIKKGSVRRAKLFYMRERIGKKAMFIKEKTK